LTCPKCHQTTPFILNEYDEPYCMHCGYTDYDAPRLQRLPPFTLPSKPRVQGSKVAVLAQKPSGNGNGHKRVGRPRTGEWRYCVGCRKPLWIERSRLEKQKSGAYWCKRCRSLRKQIREETKAKELVGV
jgi:hypothetical protein